MIALPRHLRPWAPHLDLFPEDMALALGPLVMKLAAECRRLLDEGCS